MKTAKKAKKIYPFFITISLFIILLTSCEVSEKIYLKSDGSGNFQSEVTIQQILVDYLKNLAEVTGEKDKISDDRIFDTEEIKESLSTRKGIKVKSITTPTPTTLKFSVDFINIEEALGNNKDINSTGIISFKKAGKRKIFKFYLDKKNFKQLTRAFPTLSNPMVESMGPQEDDSITEEDYLDMMKFALGETGPKAIKASYITARIKCEGKIISQKGGKVIDKNTVVFKIPLLRVLLLNQPLNYSITFE